MNTQEQPGTDSNVSVEDRVSALFGDPKPKQQMIPQESDAPEPEQTEAASDPEDGAPQVPETFEFETDGEKYILPKKLEKHISQERDYTQKSQNLSQKEKQVEFLQEQARIANFRADFEREAHEEFQQLQAYDSVLKQTVDWNSLSTDDKVSKMAQLSQWEKERESIANKLREKHQQWATKTDTALRELQSKADEAVKQRVPNWSDSTWKEISEHAKSEGYTDVELKAINDPRHKLTLWKAQQFDALKAKATKTVVDAKTVKVTPSNPMPQHVKDQLNFRKQLAKTAPNSSERKQTIEARVASMFSKR